MLGNMEHLFALNLADLILEFFSLLALVAMFKIPRYGRLALMVLLLVDVVLESDAQSVIIK